MNKTTAIESIRSLNPTASEDFLAEFSEDELDAYLQRLIRLSPEPPMDEMLLGEADIEPLPDDDSVRV